jgi:hypothetical protein
MAQIERIMAAVPQLIAQNAAVQGTLTVSEPGVLVLDRLLFGGSWLDQPALPNYDAFNWSNSGMVSGLLWNGAQQLIRGRNNPDAPSGAFDPRRSGTVIPLGNYAAQSSDTLQLTVNTPNNTIGGAATGAFTYCTPFIPENRRQGYMGALPAQVAYVASPLVGIAAGAAANVTITADSDMIVDLSSLTISAMANMSGVGGIQLAAIDALAWCSVQQITLPSQENLVLGQGVVAVPGTCFSGTREGNWFNLGYERIQGGSQLQVTIQNIAATSQVEFSIGAICYPDSGRKDGC